MPDEQLIATLVSGGGGVCLAFAVWLQQRDQTRELRRMNRSLGRILQAVGIVEDDDHGDTVPPPSQTHVLVKRSTPAGGVRIRRPRSHHDGGG